MIPAFVTLVEAQYNLLPSKNHCISHGKSMIFNAPTSQDSTGGGGGVHDLIASSIQVREQDKSREVKMLIFPMEK